jgi:uncharacterized repeat protein (TIGR03803 family)
MHWHSSGGTLAIRLVLFFVIAAASIKAQTYTVLHRFTGPDGSLPQAGVIRDSAGNLYGTTYFGGSICCGVVFKVDPAGEETVLYNFGLLTGPYGSNPTAGVIRDLAGNLYGTTSFGGIVGGRCLNLEFSCGVVYELDPAGNETVLYSFKGLGDGFYPNGVIRDEAGSLYGTASNGGIYPCYPTGTGCGVIFKLGPAGQETVLYRFKGAPDAANPAAGVIRDSAGNLYDSLEEFMGKLGLR